GPIEPGNLRGDHEHIGATRSASDHGRATLANALPGSPAGEPRGDVSSERAHSDEGGSYLVKTMLSKSTLAELAMYAWWTSWKPAMRSVHQGRFVSFPTGSPMGNDTNWERIDIRGSNDLATRALTSKLLKPSMLRGLPGICRLRVTRYLRLLTPKRFPSRERM